MVKSILRLLPAIAFIVGMAQANNPVTLRITCGTNGKNYELCRRAVKDWSDKTGVKVEVISNPTTTNGLAYLLQILSAKSSDVDVMMLDTVWPGILSTHLVDLTKLLTDEEKLEFFASLINNNVVNGKLVAIPWYTDIGLLYYRKDLLEKYNKPVPKTWHELTETARFIQNQERAAGNQKIYGLVVQGKAMECLTCNAYEWMVSFGGGSLINEQGLDINKPNAVKALKLVSSWVDDISPRGVLNANQEDNRGVFQSGNAVFMRNWPYAWSLVNSNSPVQGKVGIAPLPKGGEEGVSAGVIGGWQLAVSKYSKHPEQAKELLKYLVSAKVQKMRALESNYLPSRPALYKDADILKKLPHITMILEALKTGVARPAKYVEAGHYNRFSLAYAQIVHRALSGKDKPEDAVANMESKLGGILDRAKKANRR